MIEQPRLTVLRSQSQLKPYDTSYSYAQIIKFVSNMDPLIISNKSGVFLMKKYMTTSFYVESN